MITNKEKTRQEVTKVNSFNSHMVTSYQHPTMLKHKVMDKEEVDKIKELKAKEREERRLKMVEGTFTQAK
jgi:hypothetical protein